MTVDLTKGGKINLQKDNPSINLPNPGLVLGKAGLAWDINKNPGEDFDLDFFMVELGADGKAINDASLVHFNHKKNDNGSVYVLDDNRKGDKAGYDEQGYVEFPDVAANVQSVALCVSIFKHDERRQNFGQVNNAYCDILNGVTGEKIIHYDLTEDMSMASGFVAGIFRRESDGTWAFKALGEAYNGGMIEILRKYGLNV
jgi:tellurium resistance protein TerD